MPFVNDCKIYLEEIAITRKSGKATEASYYSALKDLIQAFVNHSSFNAQVIVAPKKTESGLPDLLLKRDVALLGYIETKDLPLKLQDIEKTDQIIRYLQAFPNLN